MSANCNGEFAPHEIFQLGLQLAVLCRPDKVNSAEYADILDDVERRLALIPGLDASRIAATAIRENLRYDRLEALPISSADGQRLSMLANELIRHLRGELTRGTAMLLAPAAVTFRGVLATWPHIKAYHRTCANDVEKLVATSQYRQAIVATWNLGYDLLRTWVYEDAGRLSDFNLLLKSRTKNHKSGERSIKNYDDFFRESEGFVLEVCRDAPGELSAFTTKTYRTLERLLDDRNRFAHASYSEASRAKAESFIESITDLLTHAPFPSDIEARRTSSET